MTWNSWRAMKARGGVCERWECYQCFVADVGPRPDDAWTIWPDEDWWSIGRLSHEDGYHPENAKWQRGWHNSALQAQDWNGIDVGPDTEDWYHLADTR